MQLHFKFEVWSIILAILPTCATKTDIPPFQLVIHQSDCNLVMSQRLPVVKNLSPWPGIILLCYTSMSWPTVTAPDIALMYFTDHKVKLKGNLRIHKVLFMAKALISITVVHVPVMGKNLLPNTTRPVSYSGFHGLPSPGFPRYTFIDQHMWEGWTVE